MNLNRSSERTGKRRLQFSIRTLLILATIVGPILGWYGPAAVDMLRDFYADEPTAGQVPALTLRKLQSQINLQNQQLRNRILQQRFKELQERHSRPPPLPSATEQIELGMRADQWERELQRVE